MTTIKSILGASSILTFAAIPAVAGTTIPELTNAATTESGWQVRAAIYGWATALDGDVTFRGLNVPVDAGIDNVLDNLDFAVMGAVEISNGQWSFLTDLFYAELSVENSVRGLDIDTDLDQFIGNFVVAYNVVDDSDTRFDVYAGARVMSLDTNLNITRTGLIRTRTYSDSASKTWVDPVIGVRAQQELPNQFFVRAVADIGGFGLSSDITWQALLGLGYHITDSGSIMLGYRGLGTDYEDGSFGYNVISHGLLLGYEHKF